MNLPLVALALVVVVGLALAFRAGLGPASAFVAVAAVMVAIQGSMLGPTPEADPLPFGAMLAFLASPLLPGFMAALLFPPADRP